MPAPVKPARFVMARSIEFADLDAKEVCHFTSFLRFFETATFKLLARYGEWQGLASLYLLAGATP